MVGIKSFEPTSGKSHIAKNKTSIKILFLLYCCFILFPFLAGNRRLQAKGKLSFNNFQTFLAAPVKKMQQLQLYCEENKRTNNN